MKRREFFRLGFSNLRNSVTKNMPEAIQPKIPVTVLDVSVLTADPHKAERLMHELVREHFGEKMLRLKHSVLTGVFPGGIVLYESDAYRDYRDGISLFYAGLRQLETELGFPAMQTDPTLLRFVNVTPPFSRNVELYHRDRLLLTVPLADEGSYPLMGTLGPMLFTVRRGALSVTESRCAHRTCMAFPAILTPGQRIICRPNEVTAVIGAHLG